MNSEITNNESDMQSADLSLNDCRELLAELREASEGSSQSELHDFSCLVSQVIDLHDRLDGDDEAAEFIASSMDEIRSVVGSDEVFSDRMGSLREQAIDQWGELLEPIDHTDLDSDFSHEGDAWDLQEEYECESEEEELVSPSAEEISSLLTSLGQSTAATPPPKEPAQPQPLQSSEIAQVPTSDESSQACIASLDEELREAFLDDARVCVSSMEAALLQLDSDPEHSGSLNQIARELHTLKGASASVGLSGLADQLHALEDGLRDDKTAGRSPCINSLLKSVDSVRSQILGNDQDTDFSPPDLSTLDSQIQRPPVAVDTPNPATPAPSTSQLPAMTEGPSDDESVRVKSSQLNRLMDMLAELVMLRNRRETELSELDEVYHELIGSVSKMRMLSNEGESQYIASSSLQLSEIANDVLEVAQNVRDCAQPVAEGNASVSEFIRQFRQELVELRRTPVSGLFRRLQRVVRDAAQSESKDVRLELVGEDAGIERTLQQRLYEPLLHIVRNSVCHGIEMPEERSRSGKNPVGTITLEAKSGPDLFVIEIRDDGGGLDYDAIRRRGVESGLLVAGQSVSHEELSQLIFQPGFSTRQSASQVAGRGVGMDVVASTLQRMRGWLEVDSEPNEGTRIRLSFPLPSVIQHAMVFRSAGQLFALPMQSVQTAGEFERDFVFLAFSELLGVPQEDSAETYQQIVLACDVSTTTNSRSDTTRITLLVDEIVGPEEVVVRPLPPIIKQHPFCSGATLSGMGETVLLLDARRIVESQHEHIHRADEPRRQKMVVEADDAQATRPRVLVVDDSLSARKKVVRSLQRYPLEVVEASNGKRALEILKTQQFAAVFSDMEMPHVTGMELLAEINSVDREHSPPVVIISSRGEDEFTNRAKELGVSSYLIKPLADEALDEALSDIPSLQHLTTNLPTSLNTSGEIQ